MNIKHGDIITLDNGDIVKVSLEVISKKVTELISGKKYELKYTYQLCHLYTYTGAIVNEKQFPNLTWIFLNEVHTWSGRRYIFYGQYDSNSFYAMFSTKNLDFVVKELN